MTDFPQHDAVLAYLRPCVDVVHETPDGSNRGPIQVTGPHRAGVDFFQEHDFLPGYAYPWCVDTWLSAWAVGAGRTLPYLSAGAYDILNWAKRAGWYRASADCVPGDALVFQVGAGHLATLEAQDGPDWVKTIDGNHGNRVARARRPRSSCLGGIHVPEDKAPDPPAPERFYVIATSESGHKVLVFTKFATEKTIAGLLPRLLVKYGRGGFTIKRGPVRKRV